MAYADDVDRRRSFRAEQVERFGPGADFEVDGDGGIDRYKQVILPEQKAQQRAWQQFWIHSGIQFNNLKPGAAVEQALITTTLQKLCPNGDRTGPPTGAKLAELITRLKAVQAAYQHLEAVEKHLNPKKKAERKSAESDPKVAPMAAGGKAKETETSETPAGAAVATAAAPAPQTTSKSKKKTKKSTAQTQTQAAPAAVPLSGAGPKPRSAMVVEPAPAVCSYAGKSKPTRPKQKKTTANAGDVAGATTTTAAAPQPRSAIEAAAAYKAARLAAEQAAK